MNITLSSGEHLTVSGCLARFGSGLGIIGEGYSLTHEIQRGRIYQVTGPAGCKRRCLGIIERIEV
jgi:hypothetical protein